MFYWREAVGGEEVYKKGVRVYKKAGPPRNFLYKKAGPPRNFLYKKGWTSLSRRKGGGREGGLVGYIQYVDRVFKNISV